MNMPERVFLIDMGDEIVWCDDAEPGEYMDKKDAVEYVRKDCTYRQAPCKTACESQAFKLEIRRLRYALEVISGKLQPVDNLLSNIDVAKKALNTL